MTLDQFCNDNGLNISVTPEGVSLTGRDGKQITPFYGDEEALSKAELHHADAILIADRVEQPSQKTVNRYLKALAKAEKRISEALPHNQAMIDRLSPMAGAELVDEILEIHRRAVDSAPTHFAEIARCRTLVQQAPARLFLPLGATVRMKRDWNVPDYYALNPMIRLGRVVRPPEGTVGYVTGAGFGSDECSLVVAFPDEFTDRDGHTWRNSMHGVRKVVHMSDVELLEFAMLPEGSPNLSVDGERTHMIDYGRGPLGGKASAMILENRGKSIFLFVSKGFDPLDESVHFFDDLEAAMDIHPKIVPIKQDTSAAPIP
jgi:hypothetical protein